MDIVLLIALTIMGYLLGSISSAVLISKIFYGQDIRKLGSGNAGTTNVLRVFGKSAALLTFVGDLLKGIIAVLIAKYIAPDDFVVLAMILTGSAAVVGHNWPIYFGFKGGKGVLTTLAIMLFIAPLPALVALGFFLIIVAITRYISLGSIIAAFSLPITIFFLGDSLGTKSGLSEYFFFALFIAALLIIRHHANIVRLFKGTESKLGEKKKV